MKNKKTKATTSKIFAILVHTSQLSIYQVMALTKKEAIEKFHEEKDVEFINSKEIGQDVTCTGEVEDEV